MVRFSGLKTALRCNSRAVDCQFIVWHQARFTDSSCRQCACCACERQDIMNWLAQQLSVLRITRMCVPSHRRAPSFEKALGAGANRTYIIKRMPWGSARSISLAFAGGRQPAHARGWGGMNLCRPTVRWPRDWGHHGVVQQVRYTRAVALRMVTIDLSSICGWSPTRACTRLGRGGLLSPKNSMATQFGTPWRGAAGPVPSRGCPGDGHHQSLWHLRVVANPRMHAVGVGWTCVAQKFDGHAIGDTMARCSRSVALRRMPWGLSPSISVAFAGSRQHANARDSGGVHLWRAIVRWRRNWDTTA